MEKILKKGAENEKILHVFSLKEACRFFLEAQKGQKSALMKGVAGSGGLQVSKMTISLPHFSLPPWLTTGEK